MHERYYRNSVKALLFAFFAGWLFGQIATVNLKKDLPFSNLIPKESQPQDNVNPLGY